MKTPLLSLSLTGLLSLCAPVCAFSQGLPVTPKPPAELLAPPRLVEAETPERGRTLKELQRLVRIAIERSPTMKEALAQARAAEQDVDEARAALYPHLSVNANTAAVKLEGQGGPVLSPRAGVTVDYNLLDFGKTRQAIASKEWLSASYQARFSLARETAAYETTSAFLQLVKYQRLIGIYESHIADLGYLVGKLADIVAVFPGRRSELTQAQARLGQARDALLTMYARKRESQLALLRQVGAGEVSEGLPDAVPLFAGDDLQRLLEIARAQHPAVLAARSEADAARASMEEAKASHLPQIDLQLSKQTGRNELGSTSPAQLYVTARWDAFQGYGNQAQERALQERAAAAEERVSQALVEIDFKIRGAQADAQSQIERQRQLEDLVQATDQVRQDYLVQWRELGRRTLLDVLTAENEHLNTRLSLGGSEVDLALAWARMRFEAGMLKTWLVGDDGSVAGAAPLALASVDVPPIATPVREPVKRPPPLPPQAPLMAPVERLTLEPSSNVSLPLTTLSPGRKATP
jgi:adhesin transport system outer membrane protein